MAIPPGTGTTAACSCTFPLVPDRMIRHGSSTCRSIDGISQRMLTVTLRGPGRDGLVTRTLHPVVPPRVEYALNPMGRTLLERVGPLLEWSVAPTADVVAARAAADSRPALVFDGDDR